MKNNFDLRKFLAENKLTTNSRIEEGQEQFDLPNLLQAVINDLINNDRQDVLDVLESIPEWDELVEKLLQEPDYFFDDPND